MAGDGSLDHGSGSLRRSALVEDFILGSRGRGGGSGEGFGAGRLLGGDLVKGGVVALARRGLSDRVALGVTKLLRAVADSFFAKRYGHRAIVLETVAAVPGMVGASMTHLRCLRRMCDDQGWIRILMEEA